MNKIEKTFASIDKKMDKHFGFLKIFFKKYFTIISTVLLASFMCLLVVRIFYTRPRLIASIMEDDIKLIALALNKIDDRCNILSITPGNTEIDFLQVRAFEGAQIGPLVLAYPKNWEGPYLSVNPTIQERYYELVWAKDGLFVVPGNDVELPNGKVVGKDFVINERETLGHHLKEGGALWYNDKQLASKLKFKIGDWDSWRKVHDVGGEIGRLIREFSEAMPYTKNDGSSCGRGCVG